MSISTEKQLFFFVCVFNGGKSLINNLPVGFCSTGDRMWRGRYADAPRANASDTNSSRKDREESTYMYGGGEREVKGGRGEGERKGKEGGDGKSRRGRGERQGEEIVGGGRETEDGE